jgi:hypothetical protein
MCARRRVGGPILCDHWARDVVEQIEVDVKSTGLRSGDEKAVALRAKQLDDWAWEFLDGNTDAVVLARMRAEYPVLPARTGTRGVVVRRRLPGGHGGAIRIAAGGGQALYRLEF